MVVGTFEGGVALLDVATGRVLARHTERLSYQISSVKFAPDGTIVALGGRDGRAHLLAADTLHEIGQLPLATGAAWGFVSYNADGSRLSAVDDRGRVMHWDTRPDSWIGRACTIVDRDFTPAEWATYLPGVPHQRTCTSS
jgi:WD40 repeat protein